MPVHDRLMGKYSIDHVHWDRMKAFRGNKKRLSPHKRQPLLRHENLYGRRAIPVIREITDSIRNRKKRTFAIPAAPAAIPPNPKTAAIIATTRKITVQRSISI